MALPASAHRSFLVAFCNVAAPDDTIRVRHLTRFLQGTEDKKAETCHDWGHICGVNAASDAIGRRNAEIARKAREEAAHSEEISALRKEIALREEFRTIEARIRNSSPRGFWQRKVDILWAYLTEGKTLRDLAPQFGMNIAIMEKEAQRGRVLFAKNGASDTLLSAIGG